VNRRQFTASATAAGIGDSSCRDAEAHHHGRRAGDVAAARL